MIDYFKNRFLIFAFFLLLASWAFPAFAQYNGDGLQAVYYNNPNLTGAAVSEVDPNISYRWGTCPPQPGMPVSGFSVKWTGQIEPSYSEPYTFTTDVTGGVSVIVNGTAVISGWTDGIFRGITGNIPLTAGVKVPLEVDYFFGGAVTNSSFIQFAWQSPSQANVMVPRAFLFSGNPLQPTPTPQSASACQSSPTVDGVLSEWAWSPPPPWNMVNKTVLGDAFGASAQFKALWDMTNLYLGVTVTDSQPTNNGDPDLFENSTVELYLDTTDSRSVTVTSNNFQYFFRWNDSAAVESRGRTAGVSLRTTTIPAGYVVEASIPWSTLGLGYPNPGLVLGFDVGVDVNHNGGNCRDGQLMWNGGSDNYENASGYGNLTLGTACPTPASTPPAPMNPYVAPNPSNGTSVKFVYEMAEAGTADIKVWNAWGNLCAAIHDAQPQGLASSVLDVSSFAPGHYFYRVVLNYPSGRQDKYQTQVMAIKK